MGLPSYLSEGTGLVWVSLTAGLLGLVVGKLYSQIANLMRTSQILAGMPKPPEKVHYVDLTTFSKQEIPDAVLLIM